MLRCAFRPAGPGSDNPHLPQLVATCSSHAIASSEALTAAVCIWDCASGARKHKFNVDTRAVAEVAWSPCGHYVAAAAMDAVARVWDVATGAQAAAVTVPAAALSVAWLGQAELCVGMTDGHACVLQLDLVN